ncbi:hypothetical protein M0R45_023097 [Rubus argutus]|uniref:Uncharacterized protein n=1 Tax=Rubus argutus TaxID=59490 RepID=A0AAW1WR55_RUBAR
MLRLPMLSVGSEEIERRRLQAIKSRPEANDVFGQLRLNGVKVDCDSWRSESIHAIESVLKKYKECCWYFMICSIAMATRKELVKSKEVIDVELIKEVVEYLEKDDDEEEEEEEEEEDDDKSDSDSDDDHRERSDSDAEEEEIDDLKDEKTRQECIKQLLERCSKMGFSVKKGQEQQILDLMIPYLRGSLLYFMAIKFFMRRVSEYIDRSCTLDDLDRLKYVPYY